MRMNAVLSNPKHPEYGQFTVPLPIPHNQYDGIMEALNAMDMGDPLARDCQMDEILGEYPILKRLEGKPVNIDELDYLAKRLDSFCYAQEGAQFQGAAVSYNYSDMTDLINLTFSCQQVTVITDFSDLEQVGRDHYMVLNGGCASKEELDALDGYETALLLIDEGNGVITPYGVVYDNGMRLSQLYDGRHFPQYFYEPPLLTLTVQQSKDAPKIWLYLPAPDLHIKRSLVRAGIVDPADMRLSFQGSEFPDAVDYVLDLYLMLKENLLWKRNSRVYFTGQKRQNRKIKQRWNARGALACNLPRNRAGPQSESSGVQKKTAVRWMRIRFWNCEPVQRRLNFRFYWFQSLTVSDASHWNAVQPQPFLSDMVLRYGQ